MIHILQEGLFPRGGSHPESGNGLFSLTADLLSQPNEGITMTQDQTPIEDLTYEQAFAELEAIITALEGEERNLEDTLTHFERGQALAKHCMALLEKAELKVQQISGEGQIPFEGE